MSLATALGEMLSFCETLIAEFRLIYLVATFFYYVFYIKYLCCVPFLCSPSTPSIHFIFCFLSVSLNVMNSFVCYFRCLFSIYRVVRCCRSYPGCIPWSFSPKGWWWCAIGWQRSTGNHQESSGRIRYRFERSGIESCRYENSSNIQRPQNSQR